MPRPITIEANALKDLKRLDEAIRSYDRAIALKPDFAEAHCNRGNALKDLQRWEEALTSYDTRALKPDMDFLLGAWMYAKLQVCDFSNLEVRMEEISRRSGKARESAPLPDARHFRFSGTSKAGGGNICRFAS
jgi:tetratricopeptide (TPR) repeat protein